MGGNSPSVPPPKELVVKWEKPTAPPPYWLEGKPANEAEQKIRLRLNERGEVNFDQTPLVAVIKTFQAQFDVGIIVDEKSLEAQGVSLDTPITLEHPLTNFRNMLSLVLRQLNLTYVIDKDCIIVTSKNAAWGAIRYYDMSYLLPDNGLMAELIATIETMTSADAWQSNGGNYSIRSVGSMLIVKADEETYFEIENLLRAISTQTPANLKPRVFLDKPDNHPDARGQGGMM